MRTIEEITARLEEIRGLLDQPDADLTALQAEIESLTAEREQLRAAAAEAQELRNRIAQSLGTILSTESSAESRSQGDVIGTAEYVDAYAHYIRTGDDRQCRALLTVNASGEVPVPQLVDEIVRTAWDNDEILSRVRRTYFRGNLKVPFELDTDPAYVHTEGTSAPTEEDLDIGIVTLIPANLKKWIRISDEVVAMGGETFLRYVYDEVTYQIIRKLSSLVIGDIVAAGTSSSSSAIGIPKTAMAPSVVAIPTAAAYLSDEAGTPVVIINRLTHASFIEAFAAGNFAVDPFAGMTVLYTSALPAYSAASAADTYAIVGDLQGAQVNYPEGDGVVIKYDDVTEAEADLVKIVGRQYVAHGVTAPGRFSRLTKPADPVTT